MPEDLKYSYDAMNSASTSIKQIAGELDELMNRMRGQINSLEGQWVGKEKEQFVVEFETFEKEQKKFNEAVNRFSTHLKDSAARAEQHDAEQERMARGLFDG